MTGYVHRYPYPIIAEEADKLDDRLLLSYNGGKLLTHTEAADVIKKINNFYSNHSEDEITAFNQHEDDLANGRTSDPDPENRVGFVYLAKMPDGLHKIGASVNAEIRMYRLSKKAGGKVILIHKIKSDDYFSAESRLHQKYWHRHVHHERFNLTAEDVEEIKAIKTL